MKKILYFIGDLYLGGIPGFLINLATELQGEFEFHFVATDNPNINPEFHKLGKARYIKMGSWEALNNYIIHHQPDIVQFGNKAVYGKMAKNTGLPIVVIERTAGPRSCGIERDRVDYVIASNKGTVPLIRKNYGGPISTIYNGLDTSRFSNITPDRLHFKPDDFVVCYCARIGGVGQGHETLIKAVLEARKKTDVKLVLIGDKPKHSAEDIRPKLRKLTEAMGEDCVFTGALEDPSSVMAGADLYVCPARHHGISNSIIEACALGKPVVATDVGQTNEIVHHGKNGYLVKVNDINSIKECIIKLKGSPKKRAAMGQYGVDLVDREFNIKKQAEKYRELYNKLLGEAK